VGSTKGKGGLLGDVDRRVANISVSDGLGFRKAYSNDPLSSTEQHCPCRIPNMLLELCETDDVAQLG